MAQDPFGEYAPTVCAHGKQIREYSKKGNPEDERTDHTLKNVFNIQMLPFNIAFSLEFYLHSFIEYLKNKVHY